MNDKKQPKKEVLNETDAHRLVEEYVETWPKALGQKKMDRWIQGLIGKDKEAFEKAFNEMILKSEFAFSFDRLHQLANGYTKTYDIYKHRREWQEDQNNE